MLFSIRFTGGIGIIRITCNVISIFLIVRCLTKITQGLQHTEITEVHSLAVHVHAAGHNTL